MEQFKAVLAEGPQGGETVPVVTAKNITLSFQSTGGAMNTTTNSLSEGNFDINADLEMVLANGQTVSSKMSSITKKLAEMETVISNMKSNDQEKPKWQAEYAIWKTMIESIQTAIGTALKANYELQNPVQ